MVKSAPPDFRTLRIIIEGFVTGEITVPESLSEFLCVRHIYQFEKGTRYARSASQTQEVEHGSAIHH